VALLVQGPINEFKCSGCHRSPLFNWNIGMVE
jgi:hypothetical protein